MTSYAVAGAFCLCTSWLLLWPGKTLAFGLMYCAALLTAVAASPKPVANAPPLMSPRQRRALGNLGNRPDCASYSAATNHLNNQE